MKWWPRRRREPLVETYLEANRHPPRKEAPLSAQTLTVIDAETTGFRLDTDRILSLATLAMQGGEISVQSLRQWLVYQSEADFNEAIAVHGILPSETAGGDPEASVMRELLPIIGGHLIVGHHIAFDVAMLSRAAQRHCGTGLRNRFIDTAALAMNELVAFHRSGYANQRPPTLEEVCTHLGLEMTERHTAAGDAFTTAEVFLMLTARMRRRLGRPILMRDLPVAKP